MNVQNEIRERKKKLRKAKLDALREFIENGYTKHFYRTIKAVRQIEGELDVISMLCEGTEGIGFDIEQPNDEEKANSYTSTNLSKEGQWKRKR